jgi:hypothetical protein
MEEKQDNEEEKSSFKDKALAFIEPLTIAVINFLLNHLVTKSYLDHVEAAFMTYFIELEKKKVQSLNDNAEKKDESK